MQFSLQAMFLLMTLLAAFCYWLTLPSVVASQFAELWQPTEPLTLNMLVPDLEDGDIVPTPPSPGTIEPLMLPPEKYLNDLKLPDAENPPSAPPPVAVRPSVPGDP